MNETVITAQAVAILVLTVACTALAASVPALWMKAYNLRRRLRQAERLLVSLRGAPEKLADVEQRINRLDETFVEWMKLAGLSPDYFLEKKRKAAEVNGESQ